MCDRNKFSSLPRDGDAQFEQSSTDAVLADNTDREQGSRSSLENCEAAGDSSFLPASEPVPVVTPENTYYEKLIGIEADPTAYPEDLIMIGSSVDIRDDSKPLLLSEETSVSRSCGTSNEFSAEHMSSQQEKTIMVMPEDVEAAGLSMQNLNNLSEAQFNTLIAIAERRQRSSESTLVSHSQYDEQFTDDSSSSDSITIVITEDGSLKLTDATGQLIVFDRTQLAALRIDVNNLTDESIQQIVQLAMPAISIGGKSSEASKLGTQRTSRLDHLSLANGTSSTNYKRYNANMPPTISERVHEQRREPPIPPRNASIRYVKNGRWKVQYEDGRFEWIGEDTASTCERKTTQPSDHSGYTGPPPDQVDTSGIMGSSNLKRSSSESSFDGGPAAKRRSAGPLPNFCCPVCDRKVYQKEPSYIVIRLPACDDCTKGKMIMLDEGSKMVPLPPTRRK